MSKLSSENNPSTFPGVAVKISKSLKKYLANNPRTGEKNPFYGKNHSPETKEYLSRTKKGKWAFNQEQYARQRENTPKREKHHNWRGGIAFEPYGYEFNTKYKQQIKEAYGFTCQLCNVETSILDIHHIDYDKQNNIWTNLLPLCKVCHGKTNYDRETWVPICQAKVKR